MQGNMTYRKARKLNAVFLLLLFATDNSSKAQNDLNEKSEGDDQVNGRSPEYFEEKLREFERNKYSF